MNSRPFQRGAFGKLPKLPLRPHRFFEIPESYVRVESRAFGPLRVHYRVLGEGPPLLLVHGLMTTSYSFRYVIDELARTRRVYVIDLPGCGRSDKPRARYDADALAAFVIELQHALGIHGCDAVGNSMGGYLCMKAALADERAFRRLVNIHSPGLPDLRYVALHNALRPAPARALLSRVVRLAPLRWAHANVHYFDESLKSLEEAHEYGDPLATREGVDAFIGFLRDTFAPRDLEAFARGLTRRRDAGTPFPIPLLLLYSRTDPSVPPSVGTKLHALVPDAQFTWLSDTSHFAHVDTPEPVVTEVRRFLEG